MDEAKIESIDDIEELISQIPRMSSSFMEAYGNFENSWQAFHDRCASLNNVLSKKQENLIQNFPNQFEKSLEDTEDKIEKNKYALDKLREEMTKAKESEKDMICRIAEYECKIHDLEKKISQWNHKKKKLEDNRDKILMYKLLTGIHFSYEGSTISGFVVNQNSKKMKPFNLNPEQLSQTQVTDSIYDVIKKASVEGSKVSE